MGSWCNRVRININGQATWISCPVVREHGVQPIDTVCIDEKKRPWRTDIRKALAINYKKAANFHSAYALIDTLLGYESDMLADFNINAIRAIAQHVGCDTHYVKQSSLPPTEETATARLLSICRFVGVDTYLCGSGAAGYLEPAAFAEAGINLVYQNFQPIPYGNRDTFIPGLSVIDWLMHSESTTLMSYLGPALERANQ